MLIVGARRSAGVTLPPLKHLGPLLVVWGAAMFMLVFIRDLGSSLMFFAAFLALLYVATGRFSFVVIGMAMFLAGACFFAETVPHVQDRVDIWLDPYAGPAGHRLPDPPIDLRPGRRRPVRDRLRPGADHDPRRRRHALLPAAQTDTDLRADRQRGRASSAAARSILIYLLIAARGFKIALMADDGFSKLLAAGLTAVFAIQAFVIIGGVTRVIPLTGVTLPFVSYGGSSILANFVLLALLLLISDRARRQARRASGADAAAAAHERPGRQALRADRRALRGARRLHVQLVGLRRRGARGQARQQAAAARAAADRARPHPRRRRHGDRPLGRRGAGATTCIYVRRYPTGALFGHPIGYSFVEQGDSRVREVPQRRAGRRGVRVHLDPRRARGRPRGGQRRRHHARPRRAAGRPRCARRPGAGVGGRDRAADRARSG